MEVAVFVARELVLAVFKDASFATLDLLTELLSKEAESAA